MKERQVCSNRLYLIPTDLSNVVFITYEMCV